MKYRRTLPVGVMLLSALLPMYTLADANGQPPSPAAEVLPDSDVVIPGKSGKQTGELFNSLNPQVRQAGSGEQLPPGQIRAGEVRQNGIAQASSEHGGPMKPKSQGEDVYMDNISVQLAFTPNKAQIIDAQPASGTLPEEQYINGEYLYVVYDNGAVVYAGTFNDPLLEHTLARSHEEVHNRKMSEGEITIRVPSSLLDAKNNAAYMQIYELGSDVSQGEILSVETAQDIADRSTAFGNSISVARIKAKLH
jgi:hypothetical protein